MKKNKLLLLLALLLTAATGAWAQTETLLTTITATAKEQASYSTEGVATVSFSYTAEGYSVYSDRWGWWGYGWSATVTAAEGYTITKCVFYDNDGASATDSEVPFVVETTEEDKTPQVNGATFGAFTSAGIKMIEVYGYVTPSSSSGPEVAWDKAEKTGSFTMPGGNVTLEPEYYPQAALTTQPTAINDVPATTDGAIVNAGTVANIGETETAQGTVMYYVSPTALDDAALLALAADQWTADVPTAQSLTEGQAYVYYYVRGNDSDTDEENFSDGDILAANALTVTIAAEPTYAVTFNAANDNTIEAGKATVTVGGTAATVTEGKLEGVKMGSEVKMTAQPGYKFRKVEVKKASAPATPLDNTTTAWTAGTFAVPAGGLTYGDAITVSGDVTLVLTDGETLTLNKGISLASGATLTVEGTGTMAVNGTSGSTASTVAGSTGTLILTSGTLTATGGKGQDMTDSDKTGASGGAAINGSVTVNGGSLTANGGNGGNCNGKAMDNTHGGAGGAAISGDVNITDGAVAATGGNGGNIQDSRSGYSIHGGAGGAAIGGNATLTGGTLTTKQGANGTETGRLISSSGGAGGKAVAGTVTDNRN